MKAYIHENELFPCYGVGLNPGSHESVVDAPEETIRYFRVVLVKRKADKSDSTKRIMK